jgi:hypothetical protein
MTMISGRVIRTQNKLRTMNGGHAERFCVGVLEIIEASERVIGEAGGCSVDEVGALGVLKNLLEGTFHCRLWGVGLRAKWS